MSPKQKKRVVKEVAEKELCSYWRTCAYLSLSGQRSATGPRQVNRKAQRLAERSAIGGAHCNLVLGTSSLRLPAHRCLVGKRRMDNKQEVCPGGTTFRRTAGKAPEKCRPAKGSPQDHELDRCTEELKATTLKRSEDIYAKMFTPSGSTAIHLN